MKKGVFRRLLISSHLSQTLICHPLPIAWRRVILFLHYIQNLDRIHTKEAITTLVNYS